MGARIRNHDWAATSLGPPETWPRDLRTILRVMLQSRFPTYLAWGPDLTTFYNDASLQLRGARPEALGRELPQVWEEIWGVVSPMVARALGNETTYIQDLPVGIVQRHGYPEETWWTASFSPITDEDDKVGGVLIILQETTERVLTERRLRFLVELGNRLRGLSDPRDVMAAAAAMLGRHLDVAQVSYGEVDAAGELLSIERDWNDGMIPSLAGRHRLRDFCRSHVDALLAGHTVRIDDTLDALRMADEESAAAPAEVNIRSRMVVPLVKGGRMTALLCVNDSNPRHWRSNEIALAQEVAERTWAAVLRARAEAALKASEERFQQFARHSTTVLWIVDAETKLHEYVSPAYETVWGEPVGAVLGSLDHWISTIHPDDRDSASKAIERAFQGEEATQEYHIIRPDGRVRWIRDTFFPIRDEQGRVRWAGGIAQDVTQHEGSMVYVVSGSEAPRRDLCLLLQGAGYEVKTFASARAFLEVAPVLVSGCVVLDIRSPDVGGLTIPKELKARRLGLPVIVIGEADGDVAVGVQVMKAGAADFLDVPYRPEQVLDALASAQATIAERAERDQAVERVKSRIAALPVREREVLEGLLTGGTNKTIARDLGISPRTVEAHRARIMERLGAHSLPELVQIAVMAGLQTKPQVAASPT